MSKRDSKLLLEDILVATDKIKVYTQGLAFDQFIDDSKTVDAVIRNFEIIGEAANRLSDDFKITYSNVNWFRIRGFRNRIVHDYMGIDYQIVWNIIENDLDRLVLDIKDISERL